MATIKISDKEWAKALKQLKDQDEYDVVVREQHEAVYVSYMKKTKRTERKEEEKYDNQD